MKTIFRPSLLGVLFLAVSVKGADTPDILLADFEGEGYGEWKADGEAFGKGPARGTLGGQQAVSGFLGKGLANSFLGGDRSQGTLTSPEFTIERKHLNFLIGGGKHPSKTCVELVVDGQAVRTATGLATTGADDEHLSWRTWDVEDLRGRKARIRLVDRETGGWGHISADHIHQSDRRKMAPQANERLTLAGASVEGASARAAADPARPAYHFLPPALWMNDPNGPIYYGGWYHMFYQHNPYGDRWQHMHWGHARSKDLVRWEHLPIALWPSEENGEEHCFSGCAAIDGRGRPLLLYTSIARGKSAGDHAEQWAAVPEDDDLLRWKKHSANPVMSEKLHGGTKVNDWRDPFVFSLEGKTYAVLGGNLNPRGGQAVVNLYRAENAELTEWKYLGVLFRHPDPKVGNIECPLFFPLGGKWVLVISPHRAVEYFTGSLDTSTWTFRPEQRGIVDPGEYYAPNCLEAPGGRRIMWGWVRGFPEGRGWNGCLTLPRVLSLGDGGRLVQTPAPELEKLRGRPMTDAELRLEGPLLLGAKGDRLELSLTLDRGTARAAGLRVRCSADRSRGVAVRWSALAEPAGERQVLDVAGGRLPVDLPAGAPLRLRVFLDRSVLEVYTGSGECITRVIQAPPDDLGVELFAEGGPATARSLEVWEMSGIW